MRERWRRMSRLVRGTLIIILAGVVSWTLFVAAWLWLPAVGSPSGDALRFSLMRKGGGSILLGELYACTEGRHDIRICEVPDAQNSTVATYRVRMDGRCWSARKTSSSRDEEQWPPMKRRVSGCVEFRDQARLLERLL